MAIVDTYVRSPQLNRSLNSSHPNIEIKFIRHCCLLRGRSARIQKPNELDAAQIAEKSEVSEGFRDEQAEEVSD